MYPSNSLQFVPEIDRANPAPMPEHPASISLGNEHGPQAPIGRAEAAP
jgi:hypothetical protein